jgi:hypothetical protein
MVRLATRRFPLGWIIAALVTGGIAVSFLSARDGGSGDSQTTAVSTGTVTTTTTTAPAPSTTAPKYVIPADTSPPTTDDGLNPLGGNSPEDRRMPDVICMNLQAAQDEIQDHGVFFSKSVDATGKGRRQILDRNWIVVDQDPKAGDKIGEGDAVLSVVKTDEPNDCP